jgi:hypothetical protein
MWNDIDLYHAFRDFTYDPVTFPGDEVREFIRELVSIVLACNVLNTAFTVLPFVDFKPPKV